MTFELLGLNDPDRVQSLLNEVVNLLRSSKPSNCLAAGYIIKLLLAAPAAPWVFADELGLLKAGQHRNLSDLLPMFE